MDDNDLARFLDRTLPEEERGSAVAHLSASDVDAELLADAAFVLRELDPDGGVIVDEDEDADVVPGHAGVDTGPGPKVVPLQPPSTRRGWRRAPARWLALAAMVAGVLLVPLALSRTASAGSNDFAVLLERREAGLPPGWLEKPPPWGARRGAGDPMTDDGRAARLGVLDTRLRLAISGAQAKETHELAGQTVHLLTDVTAGNYAAGYYRTIAERAGGPEKELVGALENGRKHVADIVGADYFGAGAWGEAARIAAFSQDASFFRRRASRKMMDRAALLLDGKARATLDAIRTAAREDQPDWTVLQTQTHELLRQIGS
jgi:hypothetical protein